MNLLYITWGNRLNNHTECIFSILTALQYRNSFDDCYIITDHPEYYSLLNKHIHILFVKPEKFDEWMGIDKFIFNIKIEGIQYFHQTFPDKNFLYADSDTCFIKPLSKIKEKIDEGFLFMHILEDTFADFMKRSRTAKRIYPIIEKLNLEKFDLNQAISPKTKIYNAGIIGINVKQFSATSILKETLELTKYFLSVKELAKIHFLEQFSFSLILEKYATLETCGEIITHYWGNKKVWDNKINSFLLECQLKNKNLNDIINDIKTLNYDYPVICRERSLNKKLKKQIDKIIPNKYKYREDMIK